MASAPLMLTAQNCGTQNLSEAKKSYESGHFNESIAILKDCLGNHSGIRQEEEAFRLMILSNLALDSLDAANHFMGKLLMMSPAYEANIFDPPQFKRLLNSKKAEAASRQVTSVSKKAENIHEAPATVIVLSDLEIRQRAYNNLAEIFYDLPGFDISSTRAGTFSNIYQRGYRSNNTDRMLVLIDGVEENDLWSNIAYINRQYPVSNIKRIEVIYGPASTMYGANAFTGVVNVITKQPADLAGDHKIGIDASVGYGSWNTKYADISIGGKFEKFSFISTFKTYFTEDYDLSGYPEFDFSTEAYDTINYGRLLSVDQNVEEFINSPDFAQVADYYNISYDAAGNPIAANLNQAGNAAARQLDINGLNTKVDNALPSYSNIADNYFFSGKLLFGNFTIGYELWETKTGGLNYFTDWSKLGSDNGQIWNPKQLYVYSLFEKQLSESVHLSNLAYYRKSDANDLSRSVSMANYANSGLNADAFVLQTPVQFTTVFLYQTSSQVRDELKISYRPTTNFDLIGGLEFRGSNLQGDYRMLINPPDSLNVIDDGTSSGDLMPGGNNFNIMNIGAYLQASYHWKELFIFTLGGRYDYNKIRKSGGYGSVFNPRIALVATPGDFIFKAIYASAFQDASNWTKYATNPQRLLANPNLNPERVTNLEVSVGYNLNKNSFIEASFYNSTYDGAVGTVIVPWQNSYTGQNQAIGKLHIMGAQALFNYKRDNYSIQAGYTYTHPEENIKDESGLPTDEYQRIGDIASHQLNIIGNIEFFNHLNINIRGKWAAERLTGPGTSVPANPGEFPATTVINTSISYFDIIKGMDLQFSCYNLLDHQYSDPGIRSADGFAYAWRTPQAGRNFLIRLSYRLNNNIW